MTPIDDRIKGSLRLPSDAIMLRSSKMVVTCGWRSCAALHVSILFYNAIFTFLRLGKVSLLPLIFMAPMMPLQASIMPSRSDTT